MLYTMENITGKFSTFEYELEPIVPGEDHFVLFQFPLGNKDESPTPFVPSENFHWDDGYVRIPYAENNLIHSKNTEGEDVATKAWDVIKASLSKSITSVEDLISSIGSYYQNLPKLPALIRFFEEILTENERNSFFNNLLPNIISLALKLPDIIPGSIPLLSAGKNLSVSLSQLQVSSLLANCFLCTFPWDREKSEGYKNPNFIQLFSSDYREKRRSCVAEKLKSLLQYFQQVTENIPLGVITYKRTCLLEGQLPCWDQLNNKLAETKIHISDSGTIEEGYGLLQVDFANKYVGGGIIGYGCVQEEIRFAVCPELIVARLFCECMGNTEAIQITGGEQYSNYAGYGDTYKWAGKHSDVTPLDSYRRRKLTIVAIDATRFNKPIDQFSSAAVLRELNKAYTGFYLKNDSGSERQPVASGNWGCGAFRGKHQIKFLIQLMACNAAKRDLVYYTFSEPDLKESLSEVYEFVVKNNITMEQMLGMLCRFTSKKRSLKDFPFPYLQQVYDHLDVPETLEIENKRMYRKLKRKNKAKQELDLNVCT